MSLHSQSIGDILAETARIARAAFPKGTVVMRVAKRKHLGAADSQSAGPRFESWYTHQ
jgi:hypothetical protein